MVGTELKEFNILVHLTNGTSQTFTINSIQLYPYNDTLSYTNSTYYITGNFTPNATGIWSLRLNLTDSQDNNITHSIKFYDDNPDQAYVSSVTYYLRPDIEPIEGQPADNQSCWKRIP